MFGIFWYFSPVSSSANLADSFTANELLEGWLCSLLCHFQVRSDGGPKPSPGQRWVVRLRLRLGRVAEKMGAVGEDIGGGWRIDMEVVSFWQKYHLLQKR